MYEIKKVTDIGAMSYCIHRYTVPCTMNQSKSNICTLATFTVRNHVLNIATIGIAPLFHIYSRKRTDRGGGRVWSTMMMEERRTVSE